MGVQEGPQAHCALRGQRELLHLEGVPAVLRGAGHSSDLRETVQSPRSGKLERFHGILTQELVGRVRFRSLSHFRRELYYWRRKYNQQRIHGGIGWKTPTEV